MPCRIFPLLDAVTARHRLNPILTLISLLALLGIARPISAQLTFTYRETAPAILHRWLAGQLALLAYRRRL